MGSVVAARGRLGAKMPPPQLCAPIWDGPVPHSGQGATAPAWWWLGAHGGAGVSALCAVALPSGDAQRRWPSGGDGQSPLVAVACRTHLAGLKAAHALLLQHAAGGVPPTVRLGGLVTVADTPGRLHPELRRVRDLVSAAAPRAWHLPFVDAFRLVEQAGLPQWHPRDPAPLPWGRKGRDPMSPPPEFAALFTDLLGQARALAAQATTP
jgi:hypothetical protein